eukprot:855328_1
MFQCRQKPGTYSRGQETMNFGKKVIDKSISNDCIEFYTKHNLNIMITGLLVKIHNFKAHKPWYVHEEDECKAKERPKKKKPKHKPKKKKPIKRSKPKSKPKKKKKFIKCCDCNGSGVYKNMCFRCDGTGKEWCDSCDGSGIFKDEVECNRCEGSG